MEFLEVYFSALLHDSGKIGVADAYDAMTLNRSYRRSMSQEKDIDFDLREGK